ncbi:hypothetical protein HZS61_014265 [Fusarium oxysporum f. sp. conglutinans]|uniref:Uncharacterized protein n=1 Tax=Fusarium oxysporum f. sp. conglutinans TaxID=100902 RepID=A0A8H6LJ76_FUSOX|nr:hypothetical protein HZS61_014265 [Fusarium oxysporum f. sp. conglutinans]
MSFSNLCKVASVDAKAPTTINTPVDMANPKCACSCGYNNIVKFTGMLCQTTGLDLTMLAVAKSDVALGG